MKPIKVPSSNIKIAPPNEMKSKFPTVDAARYVLTDEDTGKKMSGYMVGFKLDEEELKKIAETGTIYLHVMGELFPPIIPTVYTMEETFGDRIEQEGEQK